MYICVVIVKIQDVVYVDRYQPPVHCNDGPVVDLFSLANILPHELLVKIYNKYFRPVKYYQLYTYVMRNPLCIDISVYSSNKEIFVSHLPVFCLDPFGTTFDVKTNCSTGL